MKILLTSFYYKPFVGGIENSLYFLAKEYQSMGHEVVIAVSDSHPDRNKKLPSDEVLDGIHILRFKTHNSSFAALNFFKPLIDQKNCIDFFKHISFKPDIIVTRNHITGYGAIKAGLKNIVYLVPGVVKFQDSAHLHSANNASIVSKLKNAVIKNFITKYLEKQQVLVLEKVKKVFVFSANMHEQVLQVAPSITPRLFVTKPGVELKHFTNVPTREAARKQIGLPAGAFVFLILSRLAAHKSIHIAVEAFNKIKKDNRILLIVGDGPELGKLEMLAKNYNLANNIVFAGKTQTPQLYYAAANAFLLPSQYEPFGQTILEALIMGLPVVAFNSNEPGITTATSEIITNPSMGILCSNSIDAFAVAMDKIAETAGTMTIDTDYIKNKYSWKNLAEELIQL